MGHVALLRASEMVYRFGGESEEKKPLGRPRPRRE
jgi:hypothetical protein